MVKVAQKKLIEAGLNRRRQTDLVALYKRFVADVKADATTRALPVIRPHSLSVRQDLAELGFAGMASWGTTGRCRGLDPGNLVIHWPSLFRWDSMCPLETLVRRGFGSFVLILLQFEELFRRRSPLLWELLQRKVRDIFDVVEKSAPLPSHRPITVGEEPVLKSLFYELAAGQSPLVYALRESFNSTFRPFQEPDQDSLFRRLRAEYFLNMPDQRDNISVIQVASRFFNNPHLPKELTLTLNGVDPGKFTALELPWELYEMLVGYDLAFNGANPRCGAQPLTDDSHPPLLVLNMARFAAYRTEMGYEEKYRSFRRADDFDELNIGQKAADAFLSFVVKHPVLSTQPTLLDHARVRFFGPNQVWPEVEWMTSVVVNLSKFPALLTEIRTVEEANSDTQLGYETKPERKPRTEVPLLLSFNLPNGEAYQFLAVRHRRQLVFSPAFPVPKQLAWTETRSYQGEVRRKLRRGVHYRRLLNLYFYNVDALLADPSWEVSKIPGFPEWARVNSRLPLAQFHRLLKAQERQKQGRPYRESAKGLEYEPHEDAVIREHYRKGMTKADWDEIRKACPMRTDKAIARRARVLAEMMIKEGVYDIEALPIKRRDADLLRQLARARDRVGGGNEGY